MKLSARRSVGERARTLRAAEQRRRRESLDTWPRTAWAVADVGRRDAWWCRRRHRPVAHAAVIGPSRHCASSLASLASLARALTNHKPSLPLAQRFSLFAGPVTRHASRMFDWVFPPANSSRRLYLHSCQSRF
ncbi:hypothetical protein K458DRAFT_189491 [Lentithecium fluviatile CBS 122367]|uniref:Uncharacterized protein n=1 Tax=Lentithecium fluviatile CBS 122367 TaxID=1168545 RepID=A0A6G1JB38_9PLEO|nr:hypothetical protein K458DRAFT_189491 [Lentithecium fluviatile CBS 122367]